MDGRRTQITFETIRYEVEGGLARITLARPDKRNAISLKMFQELGDAAEAVAADPSVRGVLVAGEGSSFCAGIDLAVLQDLGSNPPARGEEFRSFVRTVQRPFRSLALMPKPAVAAVQGHALGAGFQLALACDLRVAAGDASLGLLEARYGLIPPDAGSLYGAGETLTYASQRLLTSRASLAREFTRSQISAVAPINGPAPDNDAYRQLARRLDELVDGDPVPPAERLLAGVTRHAPNVVAAIKEIVRGASEVGLEEELDREADAQAGIIFGPR